MIDTTHIGSLPFLDTLRAVEFNKNFSLPVLSTLPKLSTSEFMIEQLLIGMENVKFVDHSLVTVGNVKLKNFKFNFLLEKDFVNNFSGSDIKWQILGPMTFLKLFSPKSIDKALKQKILCWHIDNIKNYQEFLNIHFKNITLFLDEPMLTNEYEVKELNSFIKKLDINNIVIHNCSSFKPSIYKSLDKNISLSFDLLVMDVKKIDEFSRLSHMLYPGVISGENLNIKTIPKSLRSRLKAVTPSCGLFGADENALDQIIASLKDFT